MQDFFCLILWDFLTWSCGVEGACISDTMGGRSPGCFFWVLPKRSIPKPDQPEKDHIQRELLGTDML